MGAKCSLPRGPVTRSLALCVVLGCCLLAAEGCGSSMSPTQRVEKELSVIGLGRHELYPFAGKVLVDGLPPQSKTPDQTVVVVLFNRAQPDLRVASRPHANCNKQGEFWFSTYSPKDGLESGEYVVAIAQLSLQERGHNLLGPDGFQNLYNDPDKNEKEPEFAVKHVSPGKSDYVFDLKLAGREPVTTPGPRSVTQLLFRAPD